jgi:hypothetical protein
MGFRTTWLEHEGFLSVHTEDFLHAIDRIIPEKPIDILLIGVGNGGDIEVWKNALPEGSTVVALDDNALTSDLDLGVLVADLTDASLIRSLLFGSWFHVVIDATGTFMPHVWPFLRAGGVFVVENYQHDILTKLVRDLAEDNDSVLPTEEIMFMSVFPNVISLEKRNPRVVPYLKIITGKHDPVVNEKIYQEQGAKRVVVKS